VPTNPAGISVQPLVTGLQFQKKSDWGSRFAGESLMYTITVISPTGTLTAGGLRDVVVTDQLPTNLEVAGPIQVSDQNARVEQQGNQITVRVGTLPAGQTLTIMIPVKIKSDVAAQTRIVNQAQLRYAGISDPVYSNIASVLVVGAPPPLTATAIANANASAVAVAATPNPATITAGTGIGGGVATPQAGVSQTDVGATNPATSTGFPLLGFVLFGLTMLVHNVRVRREMTHI
jgi:fimbrial isopeptide formation D2 family protein